MTATGTNPSGLCMCGCGKRTNLAPKTDMQSGDIKGEPRRFIYGHWRKTYSKAVNRFEHRADGTTVIFLEHKKKILECVIDTADYSLVKGHRWYAKSVHYIKKYKAAETYYARAARLSASMEHLLLPPVDGKTIDHIDRNSLNNKRSNLRYATPAQQTMNQRRANPTKTSKYRGVSWNKNTQKFRTIITLQGKKTHVGLYESEEDAARAYDAAAIQHFGEFARTNFNQEGA
jgi:AP2 domain/HNH endonuclease